METIEINTRTNKLNYTFLTQTQSFIEKTRSAEHDLLTLKRHGVPSESFCKLCTQKQKDRSFKMVWSDSSKSMEKSFT